MIRVTRYKPDWKPVKANIRKEPQVCERCNNNVQYLLVYSGGLGLNLSNWFESRSDKLYAFKCPICPRTEPISTELANALIKGG